MEKTMISLSEFEKIDTSRIKYWTDKELIRACRSLQMDKGWGLVTELLKRFKNQEKMI